MDIQNKVLEVEVMVGRGLGSQTPVLLGTVPRKEAQAERRQAGHVAVGRVGALELLLQIRGGKLNQTFIFESTDDKTLSAKLPPWRLPIWVSCPGMVKQRTESGATRQRPLSSLPRTLNGEPKQSA